MPRLFGCAVAVLFISFFFPLIASSTDAPPAKVLGARPASSVHFYWPCLFDMPFKDRYGIVIDGKQVGDITACEHRRFAVSPGAHGIKLVSPLLFIDVAKAFGLEDPKYKVSNGPIYFRLVFFQYIEMTQVPSDVAQRDIAGM